MSTTYNHGDVKCPKTGCTGCTSKVVDSRGTAGGTVRRRRECLTCGHRFTTFEHAFDSSELSRLLRQARALGHQLLESTKI